LNLYKAKDAKVLDNRISSNTEHGIFCTRECENILLKSNHILDNGRNGIVLNEATTNSTVRQNIVKDNNRSGIAIWNSSENIVEDNLMQQNGLGITIAQNSSYNIVNNNSISNSFSNGILLDTNSTKNRIEKNLVAHSGGPGINIKNASYNALVRNDITENSNGMVLSNATSNELVSNNISANAPYNYYIRTNSKLNVVRDTYFDDATLRFFDNSTNIILENTDNRITTNDYNEKVPVRAYSKNATMLLEPVTKNVPVNTLDMFIIPSKENVEIYSISKDFDVNQKYKKWLEKSPLLPASDDKQKTSTRYIVGNFAPDTQIMIRVNSSFWNAYTSNSSGYIDFVYDGYPDGLASATGTGIEGEVASEDLQPYRVLEFEAEASNRPTLAVVAFFSTLIAGSIAFIIIRIYLRSKKIKVINSNH
jgi:parallel beta-helix repeat protein